MTREGKQKEPRLVLIDDDTTFCHIMSGYAKSRDVPLDTYESVHEMGLGRLANYAAAIVDFDLGPINGLEVAEYIPTFFTDLPVILVSGKDRRQWDDRWPSAIRRFVHKDEGPAAILDAAEAVLRDPAPREPTPAAALSD